MIKQKLASLIENAAAAAKASGALKIRVIPEIELERPKEKAHGDWATNLAFVLASQAKKSPQAVAKVLIEHLDDRQHFLERVEVAGRGFINFFLSNDFLYQVLLEIDARQEKFGQSKIGKGQRVQVEFVSANPVGPMHLGHGRWAAVGDTLANLLEFTGHNVIREFYINDYGSQMEIFGKSVALRYAELLGEKIVFPPDGYKGEYIREIAQEIVRSDGEKYLSLSPTERAKIFSERAYLQVLEHIKNVLHSMGVDFDVWFSESSLHRSGALERVIARLDKKGYVYQKDGATWLKTTAFGDDKDRVLIRESGEPTYFAADIAYHQNKFERGFEKVINIWGADHHGYVKRVKAALACLGYSEDSMEVIIGQLVNLWRAGEPVRMSKRTGEMVTLEELLQEVGKDAARYFFLMRSTDTPLDFDIELAKTRSADNPVYYVQYAHARICSILRFAKEEGFSPLSAQKVSLERLKEEAELDLIRKLAEFEEVVEKAVLSRAPYLLTKYAEDLASIFHVFYTKCRVITEDKNLSYARLALVNCTLIILRNVLRLMGVSTPERM